MRYFIVSWLYEIKSELKSVRQFLLITTILSTLFASGILLSNNIDSINKPIWLSKNYPVIKEEDLINRYAGYIIKSGKPGKFNVNFNIGELDKILLSVIQDCSYGIINFPKTNSVVASSSHFILKDRVMESVFLES